MQDRTVEARETIELLQQMFAERLLPSIPARVAIRNAHAAQMDIFGYATDAPSQDAAEAFVALVQGVRRG